MELEMAPFDLNKAATDVLELLSPKAAQKNLKLTLDFNKDVPFYLIGDSMRIRQILHNLVGNAIKFTDKGEVSITVSNQPYYNPPNGKAMVMISVKDQGIGLTDAQRRMIFNKFVQADSSTTRKFGGTGLGLAICQMFVQMLGGEISVESQEGKGSTFSFTMLLDIATKQDVKYRHKSSSLPKYINSTTTTRQKRVLMAEDNRINAEFAKEMLEKLQCEVIVAKNGQEAVEILQKDPKFDLIFMDCQMPVMDGFEATSIIIDYEVENNRKHIPIIALTANAMKGDGDRCIKAGMDDYLSKPVRQKDFADIITKWLEHNKRD